MATPVGQQPIPVGVRVTAGVHPAAGVDDGGVEVNTRTLQIEQDHSRIHRHPPSMLIAYIVHPASRCTAATATAAAGTSTDTANAHNSSVLVSLPLSSVAFARISAPPTCTGLMTGV